jgi:Myb-like DNA-binding domain
MKRRSDDSKKSKVEWSDAEDNALLKAVLEDQQGRRAEAATDEEEDWDEIAKSVPGRTPVQCLKRYMLLNAKEGGGDAPTDNESPSADTPSVSAPPALPAAASAASATLPAVKREDEGDDDEEDDDEDYEEDELGEKDSKRARTDEDTSTNWPSEETELLKKLVEQYKDSE